ncbi:hypothetical protein OEG84_14610 [Hoeflea sp. G2-23]|uniref:GIY-YIG domain-containing protein n=1 Tax=Hoeflea algicola TaxID=2983763 RepID=A0ABT3ZAU9_9HYPH|nr:hypothetical protein [Hoeflea algicola]MCY0148900.1 hypothetical protein [Hoeflea algicola]
MSVMTLEWDTIDLSLNREKGGFDNIGEVGKLKERYVYYIKTPNSCIIGYPNGNSNVCYIGQSGRSENKRSRVASHALGWILRYQALTHGANIFTVSWAYPRRQGMKNSYKDVEAYMIREFHEKFGSTPLFNKRMEVETGGYDIDLNCDILKRRRKKAQFQAFSMDDLAAMKE